MQVSERSCFNLVVVEQTVEKLKLEKWALTERVQKGEAAAKSGLLCSLAPEDMFQRLKRKIQNQQHHTMANVRKFSTLIEKEVMHKVGHFKPLSYKEVQVPRSTNVLEGMFQANIKDMSVPEARSFAGVGVAEQYYSPAPENTHQRVADMALCRYCDEHSWDDLEHRWLCTLLDCGPMILRRIGTSSPWYWALGHVAGSAALGWRASEDNAFGLRTWGLAPGARGLEWLVVTSLNMYEGFAVKFTPPSWRALKSGMPLTRDSIKAFKGLVGYSEVMAPEPLINVVARSGFSGMNRTALVKLAEYQGVALPAGSTLFMVLWLLLEHNLPDVDEETRLLMLHDRGTTDGKHVMKLLEMDGAIETLDKGDAAELKKATSKNKETETASQEFREAYKAMVGEVQRKKHDAKGGATGGRGHGKGGRGRGRAAAAPKAKLPAGEISQADVKALLPPASSVWQAWQYQSWQFHVKPHRRFSVPWRVSNCRDAAIDGLRRAWQLHLETEGLDESHCFVEGLFG